ncbi:hypothetical protein Tco_1192156 [Tanacetum coccineum]
MVSQKMSYIKWRLLKITLQAPFLNVQMTFEHNSSSLGRQCQMASAENNTSGPVPQCSKDRLMQQIKPRSSSKILIQKQKLVKTATSRTKSWNYYSTSLLQGREDNSHKVVRLGINPMIQPEPEDLPKDNPKLEIAVLRMKKKCMDKGSKERSPPHNLRQKPGQYICCQNHKLIADIENDIMDPVMQCTTLPSHSGFSQQKLVSFVTEIHTLSIDISLRDR